MYVCMYIYVLHVVYIYEWSFKVNVYCFLPTGSHTYTVAEAVQKLLPPICSPQLQQSFDAEGQSHGDEQDDIISEEIQPAAGLTEEEEEEQGEKGLIRGQRTQGFPQSCILGFPKVQCRLLEDA